MKKYSNKKRLNAFPNFESEINGFVAKFDIFDAKEKKELKEILKLHFKNISSFGVDMWQIKQRIDQSMQKVVVNFKHGKDMLDANGLYDYLSNEIDIRKLNARKNDYFSIVVHELTHCLSSSRQVFKNKPNYKSGANSTGFITCYSDTINGKSEYFKNITNSCVLTEAITEYLSLNTIIGYYGTAVSKAYFQEQKVFNQLKMIAGPKLVKAYFENDNAVFESLFENICDTNLSQLENAEQLQTNVYAFLKNIEYIFKTQYGLSSKGNALYQNDFFNINVQNLQLFQIKIVSDLLKNMDAFYNGMDVKKAILNSFTMYAGNVFMGQTVPNARFFYDFWNLYFDTLVETIKSIKEPFKQNVGIDVPLTNDSEALKYVFYAQCLSFKNYLNIFPLTKEINVVDMQDFPLEKYLPKDLNVQNKFLRSLKDVIFSDLTQEYFDVQQYYGSTCYDDANQALFELKQLGLSDCNDEDFYIETRKPTRRGTKSDRNFEN